jgi:integrase
MKPTQGIAAPRNEPLASYLDPNQLNLEARRATQAFQFEGQSPNTRRTYETALLYWGAWYALRYGEPLAVPVPSPVVMQFVLDHLQHSPLSVSSEATPFLPSSHTSQHLLPEPIDQLLIGGGYKAKPGPWSLATVETRLAALSRAHDVLIANDPRRLAPDTNPLRNPAVRQLMSAVRRTYARRPPDQQRARPAAATRSVMEALLATCTDDLIGVRDRALLLFGFASGGRRRSEIVAATLENVRRDGDGFIYELGHSKTNQSGRRSPENFKPIQGEAAAALETWLQELFRSKITQGAIFRRILNGQIREPLKGAAVRDIVRRRAQLTAEPLGKLSAHSLRSGFVTESGRQNIAIGEAMALTGHRSVQTFISYYRTGEAATSAAAHLMESKK